jgi:hypothetical protein
LAVLFLHFNFKGAKQMENKHNPKPSDDNGNNKNVNDSVEPNADDELLDDELVDEFETASAASTVADKPPKDRNLFF